MPELITVALLFLLIRISKIRIQKTAPTNVRIEFYINKYSVKLKYEDDLLRCTRPRNFSFHCGKYRGHLANFYPYQKVVY